MKRAEIQEKIKQYQDELAKYDSVPEDRFHFGTILQFVTNSGLKWYIIKTGEESWSNLKANPAEGSKTLAEFILTAVNSNVGPFEVYEFNPKPQPFYAKE